MFCTQCGREISEEVKFCPYCGSKTVQNTGESFISENSNDVLASCEYIYTEESFYIYKNIMYDLNLNSDSKSSEMDISKKTLVILLIILLELIFVFTGSYDFAIGFLVVEAIVLVTYFLVRKRYRDKYGNLLKNRQENNIRNDHNADSSFKYYFAKHGANIEKGSWAFRERIVIRERGITISFGPLDCDEKTLLQHSITYSWDNVAYILPAEDYIVILQKDANFHYSMRKSYTKVALLSSPEIAGTSGGLRFLGELEEHSYRCEDVLIPKDYLQGMTADQLLEFIKERVNNKKGN